MVLTSLEFKALAVLALVAGLLLTLHFHDASVADKATQACLAAQQKQALALEVRQQQAVQKAVADGQTDLLTVARAGSTLGTALDRAAGRLRYAPAVCAVPASASAASPGSAASAAVVVPAELLSRLGDLARYADTAHVAGNTCERAWPVK